MLPQLQAFIYTNTYNFSQALEETNTVLFIIPFFLDMEAENKEVKSWLYCYRQQVAKQGLEPIDATLQPYRKPREATALQIIRPNQYS